MAEWPPNPFLYDRPVEPVDLIDRAGELESLVGLAEAGQSARVVAPRRFGKTSLLRTVLAEVDKRGLAGVYVDLDGALTVERVALRIEQAYRTQLQGALGRTAVNLIRTLRPRLRAPGGLADVAPRLEDDPERLLEQMLDLPRTMRARSGVRTVVVFDEFQYVLRAGNELDRVFRSRIQHQAADASYIFAGSHPGLMTELFAARERPFYAQSRPITLSPLDDGPVADYVADRFSRTGREVGPVLEPLLDVVSGHPQRAMLLAHHLWEQVAPGAIADHDDWIAALDAADLELADGFKAVWDRLPGGQQRVLAALAAGQVELYGRRVLTGFGLTKGAAREGEKALVRFGDVVRDADGIGIVDPLFERWIRTTQAGRGWHPASR